MRLRSEKHTTQAKEVWIRDNCLTSWADVAPAGARHVVVLRRRIMRDVVLTHTVKDKP
jgi:hypothetical protein